MKMYVFLLLSLFCFQEINAQIVNDREEIDFVNVKNSIVLFTLGQSNSANYGKSPYTPKHNVYNYFQGKLYKAKDPLLGATGKGASVWGILGDKLIEAGKAEAVTIIPIGIGSVTVGKWAKGGVHHQLLLNTIDELNRLGVKIDYICWHQGESDNISNTSTAKYKEQFLTIRDAFRSRGVDAPMVVAVASYHPNCVDENEGCSDEIRDAQIELAREYGDIYMGPDTDKLNKCYQRGDGVHFSRPGQLLHANMWLKALKKLMK